MITTFPEASNTPLNPRKYRWLDDEPSDTGDPRGNSDAPLPAIPNPVDARIPSYKEKLIGNSPLPAEEEAIIDEDEIEILDGDVQKTVIDEIINIDFSKRIRDLVIKSLDQIVVVKLLGCCIGYNTLRNKLYELWKPSQAFRLIDIENDYFLLSFKSLSDFLHAVAGGPWTIFGSYLTVEPWTEDFSMAQPYSQKVIAWIRLPGLPPLVSKLIINGQVQLVEYESLPMICFSCGKYGHNPDSFPERDVSTEGCPNSEPVQSVQHLCHETDSYGLWMLVE
ncbi:hypothetical protein V6N11_084235 [Hibiscus sabdariffa]|uniref:DUF4283 domain-containing protein n=1 Tax=Hibiscus sabdariffa TaxID=183260 RepID=A0ABR2QSF0_9ROSI